LNKPPVRGERLLISPLEASTKVVEPEDNQMVYAEVLQLIDRRRRIIVTNEKHKWHNKKPPR